MDSSLPQDPMLWKVVVLCEGIVPAEIGVKRPKPERVVRAYRTVILIADGGNEAMEAAKSFCDGEAPPDVRWKCFTPLNAARIMLPLAAQDLQ
jgi:hypothetical protein